MLKSIIIILPIPVRRHLRSKHTDRIDPEYADEIRSYREQQKIRQAQQMAQRIHDGTHPDCDECEFVPQPQQDDQQQQHQ